MAVTEKTSKKKVYSKPVLLVYGDIRELTQSNNPGSGMIDSHPSGTRKTGP